MLQFYGIIFSYILEEVGIKMKKIYALSLIALAIFAMIVLSSCNPLVTPQPNPGDNGGGTTTSIATSLQYVRENAVSLEGKTVTVDGTVICAPGEIAPYWAYVQNGDYGILIDGDASSTTFKGLKRKDKVKITGILNTTYKAKYLEIGKYGSPATITAKLGIASALPNPKVVTIDQLNTDKNIQGTLIELKDVSLVDPSTWPAAGKEVSVIIKDTTGATTVLRIDKDTDIDGTDAPSGTFDVIGIAAWYYSPQILPRNNDDIIR